MLKYLTRKVAGTGVGALYLYAGYRIHHFAPYGCELAILASVILGWSSIPRFIMTGRPLSLILSLLSAAGLLYYGMR